MWWKVVVEVVVVAAILVTGGSFWACLKSSKHLNHFLGDISELRRLIDYLGPAKLADEGGAIEPVFGSFAKNIELFERAHLASLRQTAMLVFIGIVLLLIISLLLGVWYFAISLIVFLLLSIGDIPASAKNNNATHVHTVISNIYKWNQTDPEACRSYCIRERPSLMHLYGLVSQLPRKA